MAQNARLKIILEKQDAADRAQVAELARQAAEESRARASRSRILGEWRHLCGVLAQTIEIANNAMTGDRKLYLQHWRPFAEDLLAEVILMFEDNYPDDVEQKCMAVVNLDGTVFVSLKPQNKEYRLDISTVSIEQIESIVYDFIELNI
ncbi:hypothetical protein ACQR16_06050 [Bradyrhizobium oligotrophicum]|uniref:hypothetical protein n=1 Tax=Bradyrhizobium oligotrophicum TaxID=44255 RepID=UPI003EC086B6